MPTMIKNIGAAKEPRIRNHIGCGSISIGAMLEITIVAMAMDLTISIEMLRCVFIGVK